MKIFTLKEILVKNDMSFQISILGRRLTVSEVNIDLSPIHTIQRLQDLIFILNSLNVCNGIKRIKTTDVRNERISSTVIIDTSGTLRHEKCSLLLAITSVCSFCQKARRTITAKMRRLKRSQDKATKIRLKLSPNEKKNFMKLREKRKTVQRAKNRVKVSLNKLKAELDECQQKILDSEKSFSFYLESSKLPPNQIHALREIVAAAKCKDAKKGRRYSEEWLLLCMLLHMRSPTGYNFLRNNNIVPLPCVRTIRKYVTISFFHLF